MFLKKLMAAARTHAPGARPAPIEYPLDLEDKLNRVHSRAPVKQHLDILHGGLSIGAERFIDLYFRCLEHTSTVVTPFNVFQRFQTRHDLVRYFFATLDISGARVECGAYRGATALLLCHTWRSRNAQFRGQGYYLIDSFTGTGTSSVQDLIPVREPGAGARMKPFFPAGQSDVTPDMVRGYFTEFPEVEICAGWVPDVFDSIREESYAFVHIDLTLHEATLAALDYFYPKLSEGGVIFCDGSIFCPGVEKAVEHFSMHHDVPYAVLGHRQFVFLKRAA